MAIQTEFLYDCPSFDPDRYSQEGSVQLGPHEYQWEVWDGQRLGKYVAIDTETTVSKPHLVPRLCLLSISDGQQHYLAKPDQLQELIAKLAPESHLVFHNAAFDFWVLDRQLVTDCAGDARNRLWTMADQQQIHCTMLLGVLVTLAESDNGFKQSLDAACQRYLGFGLEKDAYRLRFAEILNVAWADIDPGFLKYAAGDAIATRLLFTHLTRAAVEIAETYDLPLTYGPLTESIQTRGAIALASVVHNGMHIDREKLGHLQQGVEMQIAEQINRMESLNADLFDRYKKTGLRKINKDSGLPKLQENVLRDCFAEIAQRHELAIKKTEKGSLSLSQDIWNEYRELDPIVDAYLGYKDQTKLRQFFKRLQTDHIHPNYNPLVRTGRSSCHNPNLQQIPRTGEIRQTITARPGNLLYIIDYSSIELRTLATVCYQRFGFSKLRDVLIAGVDPHSHTAAIFAGVSMGELERLPDRKELRQRAKPFNFGIAGGLGAESLVSYAKGTYGVTVTVEDAKQFIDVLSKQVYPELSLYLAEDTPAILAKALDADPAQVRAAWPEHFQYIVLQKILKGKAIRKDGSPYAAGTLTRYWNTLGRLCRNAQLQPYIESRDTSATSPLRKLLFSPATTLTGRVRGGVPFAADRNTPFQGLAADGCKMALWNLLKAGYRIVGFVHDEIIVELNVLDDFEAAKKEIYRICQEAMQPFVPGIPVPLEYCISERWTK